MSNGAILLAILRGRCQWPIASQHQNSIENARFVINQPGVWIWVDFPATRHQNGGVFSFADGHAELWHWRESRTIQIGKMPPWIQNQVTQRGDRDLRNLAE